ncbi:AAA family ATPase [Novosphingobium panipatense]
MIIDTEAANEFIDHVVEASEDMKVGLDRFRLIVDLAGQRSRVEGNDAIIRTGITTALEKEQYFSLAKVAVQANVEHAFIDLLGAGTAATTNFYLDVGRLLAHGTQSELDDLVNEVCVEGWEEVDLVHRYEQVPHAVSRNFAERLDEFAQLNPGWLQEAEDEHARQFEEDGDEPMQDDHILLPVGQVLGCDLLAQDDLEHCHEESRAAGVEVQDESSMTDARPHEPITDMGEPSFDDTFRMIPMSAFLERPSPLDLWFSGPCSKGAGDRARRSARDRQKHVDRRDQHLRRLGADFAGFEVPEPVRVWHMNTEDSSEETQRRFTAFAQHNRIGRSELHNLAAPEHGRRLRLINKLSGTPQPSDQGIALRKAIVRNRLGLLVLDPLVFLHDLDENSNAEMAAFFEFLQETARDTSCAILLVHHARKDKGGQSMDVLRGASAIAASARSVYTLCEEDGRNEATLTCVKSNNHSRASQSVSFERQSVTLDNGDQVGVLVPCNTAVATAGTPVRRRSQ